MLKDLKKRFVEILSPVPVAQPLRLRVPSQSERIMALVRHEQAMAAKRAEVETFEDADDFDLDDGEEWSSPYEEVFDPAAVTSPPVKPAEPSPPPTPPGPPASGEE